MKRLIVVFGVVLGACRDAHPEIVHPSPAVAAHYLGTAAMAAQAAKAVRPAQQPNEKGGSDARVSR